MASPNPHCRICFKKVLSHNRTVFCSLCQAVSHQNCLNLYSPKDIAYATDTSLNWTCPKCLSEHFPFYVLESPSDLTSLLTSNTYIDQTLLDQLLFDPFAENDMGNVHDDIDPDTNYFNSDHRLSTNCQYLQIEAINSKIHHSNNQNSFSIYSMNIRSLKKNYSDLKLLISSLDIEFSVLALTESWLKPHNCELFPLSGFNHEHLIRPTKTGGGVSIYIKDSLDYKIRHDLSSIDSIAEILWVEFDKSKTGTTKNILLGCLYRIPGIDISEFNTKLLTLFEIIKTENKIIYHLGDYNIDLIKHSSHPPTNDFIDINFAHSYYPIISKPTELQIPLLP